MKGALAVGLVAAASVLGILNSGGYRYGASDQAFYLPAVVQHLDPSLFPRDRALLHAQDRFMLFDDMLAAVARTTRLSIPILFFSLFLGGLILHFSATLALGRLWYRSTWGIAALVFVMTLRHRISRTGVNTLEGYLHPRMLAFAIGSWAVVAFMRGRTLPAVLLVAVAGVLHPTTALWFAVWIGAAIVVAERRWRRPVALGATAAGVVGGWLLWAGPLREQSQQMDEQWLAVLAVKDYLFATEWPVSAWLVNLAYPVVVWIGYRMRVARSLALPREQGLVVGALVLTGVFFLSLPFVVAHVALAVQLQVPRVFWMIELLAAVYLVWMSVESPVVSGFSRTSRTAVRRWVTAVVAIASLVRGGYIMGIEQPDRRIFQVFPPADQWTDVMAWLRRTPTDTHVLAHPDHAFLYGSSERVFGERDVFVEGSKDTALAIYSRAVAHQVFERLRLIGDFDQITSTAARSLADKYDLDYLITERPMELPRAYQNGQFNVYALKTSSQ